MSKRKTMDKVQIRERRNRLLESAAAAELSLTEGVREMRAIAGMTQEEFARHREVSARVIKAIEVGQGNPTVATLNRIAQFFGLEVGFVPMKRTRATEVLPQQAGVSTEWLALPSPNDTEAKSGGVQHGVFNIKYREFARMIALELLQNAGDAFVVKNSLPETLAALDRQLERGESVQKTVRDTTGKPPLNDPTQEHTPAESTAPLPPARKKRKPRSP